MNDSVRVVVSNASGVVLETIDLGAVYTSLINGEEVVTAESVGATYFAITQISGFDADIVVSAHYLNDEDVTMNGYGRSIAPKAE